MSTSELVPPPARAFDRSRRAAALARAVALAGLLAASVGLTACSEPPDPQPIPGGAGSGATGLGDLQAEVAYGQSNGHGTIQVLEDPTLGDIGFATIGPGGQRVVLINPFLMAQTPPGVQNHFLQHEFGHHYLQHETGPPGPQAEFMADAFAARVVFATAGPTAVQQAISWFASTGTPAIQTHPSHAARAGYLADVLAAVQADPTQVPAPPGGGGGGGGEPSGAGTLVIGNPFAEGVYVFVDLAHVGGLYPGQSGPLGVPPGAHRVTLQGATTGFVYYDVEVQVGAGQTVQVP